MNIGIAHTHFDIIGGAEQTTLSMIDALKKTDHITTLYTVVPPQIKESKNFRIHKIPKGKIQYLKAFTKFQEQKKLFDSTGDEDILIINQGGFMMQETKAPRVLLFCHSTFSSDSEYRFKKISGIKGIYLKKYQNLLKKSFEYVKDSKVKIISNSDFTRREIKKIFDKDSKVIFPPVNIQKFDKVFDHPREKKIITVTRIAPEKNLEFAIDVMNDLDYNYDICGYSNGKILTQYLLKLKNTITRNGINFQRNLSSEEKIKLLSSAKVLFHTAIETFGITVVEAIAAGCIPIVINNSANSETVPFDELRYEGKDGAITKIKNAIEGKYDFLKPKLKNHIENFSEDVFQNSMITEIETT